MSQAALQQSPRSLFSEAHLQTFGAQGGGGALTFVLCPSALAIITTVEMDPRAHPQGVLVCDCLVLRCGRTENSQQTSAVRTIIMPS